MTVPPVYPTRTPKLTARGRANLRLVPPSPNDPENWKRLMNVLFIHEEDALFHWARSVRATVEEESG